MKLQYAVIPLILLSPLAAQLTTVSQLVTNGDGTPFVGEVVIAVPPFSSRSQAVRSRDIWLCSSLNIITGCAQQIVNGVLTVQLQPNGGGSPAGTSYFVSYYPDVPPGRRPSVKTEYWVVPTGGPYTIDQVKVAVAPTPSILVSPTQLNPSGYTTGQFPCVTGGVFLPCSSAPGTVGFSDLLPGTNTKGDLIVGSGSRLLPSGSGVIDATHAAIADTIPIQGSMTIGKQAVPTGSELIPNPTFSGGVTPTSWDTNGSPPGDCWTGNGNSVTFSWGPSCFFGLLTTSFPVTSGHTYLIEMTVTSVVGNAYFYPWLQNQDFDEFFHQSWFATLPGTYYFAFTSIYTGAENFNLAPRNFESGSGWTASLVSVKEISTISVAQPLTLISYDGSPIFAFDPVLGNAGIGAATLESNTTGVSNTAIGYAALNQTTTGSGNAGIGLFALRSNTAGSNNIAIGASALNGNTTGSSNFAAGSGALSSNDNGSGSIAIGDSALSSYDTIGGNNIALGQSAMHSSKSGTANIAIGPQSMGNTTTGSDNIGIGFHAGSINLTGSDNTWIGHNSNSSNPNPSPSHQTVIGAGATAACDSCVVLGRPADVPILQGAVNVPANSSSTCTAGQVAWGSGFAYFCIATNTWQRAALVSW